MRAFPLAPLAALVALTLAAPAEAQISERTARIAPSVASFAIRDSADDVSLTQVAVPFFLALPVGQKLSFDIGGAFATTSFTRLGTTASFAGVTDVQVRGTWAATDFLVLTFGFNAPTGRATVPQERLELAGLAGTDILGLAVPAYGIGPAVTAGMALGRGFGDWNVSGGLSVRQASGFEPFAEQTTRFVPGSEYRFSGAIDRTAGAHRLSAGATYAMFGSQEFGTAATSTGDRLIVQAGYIGPLGDGKPELMVSGWHLATAAGLFNALPLPAQNLTNVQVALGFRVGESTIEPNLEARVWDGGPARTGNLTMLGVRTRIPVGGFVLFPGASFGVGSLSHSLGVTAPFSGSTTGFRATLGMGRSF